MLDRDGRLYYTKIGRRPKANSCAARASRTCGDGSQSKQQEVFCDIGYARGSGARELVRRGETYAPR